MDTHQDQTSVFAGTMFLNAPGVGLAAEYPRKFSHVSLAIFGVSEANVGLGQQFVRRVPHDLTKPLVDSGEAETGSIGLDHADAG
jgi:hypothetical protein